MRRNLHVAADRKLITAGGNSRRWLRVEVVAPRLETRLPLSLALVLDRSGSMDGDKLDLARHGAIQAIRSLGNDDRVSVVVYDHAIDVLVPSARASEVTKASAEQLLRTVEARGYTNLSGGWLHGCEQVGLGLEDGRLGRCLLLTDGLANQGITSPVALVRHAEQLRERNVTTSTLGVGRDFDEQLLRQMAEAGGGNFYFAETSRQIADFIAGETGEALKTVTRGTLLVVDLPPGASVVSPNPYRMRTEGSRAVFELGSLVADQVLGVILCIEFAQGNEGEAARVDCWLWDEGGVLDGTPVEQPFTYVSQNESATQKRDLEVARPAASAYADRARQKALAAGRRGDYAGGRAILETMAERLRQYAAQDPEILAMADGLEEEASKLKHLSRVEYKRTEYTTSVGLTSRGMDGMTLGTMGFLTDQTLRMVRRAESHGSVQAPFFVTVVTGDEEATQLAEAAGRALADGDSSRFGYTVVDRAARVLDPGRGVQLSQDDERGLAYALGAQGSGVKVALVRGALEDGSSRHWYGTENVAIVSLDGWDDKDAAVEAFVAHEMVVQASRLGHPTWDPQATAHSDVRGCWGDDCPSRADLEAKLRAGELCDDCRCAYKKAGIDVDAFLGLVAKVRALAERRPSPLGS